MAPTLLSFAPPTVRVFATAAKGAAGGGKEEKGLLDFILGSLTKQDQFYETDPILQKVDEKAGGTAVGRSGTTSGRKGTVSVQVPKKKGGFGGLFAKSD